MHTLEITHEDHDDPEQADEGDIQMEYSRLEVQPKYRKSNKKITCNVYVLCINWNNKFSKSKCTVQQWKLPVRTIR